MLYIESSSAAQAGGGGKTQSCQPTRLTAQPVPIRFVTLAGEHALHSDKGNEAHEGSPLPIPGGTLSGCLCRPVAGRGKENKAFKQREYAQLNAYVRCMRYESDRIPAPS